MASANAAASAIVWSEGSSSISGSGSVSTSVSAATAAAGAVLRPTGAVADRGALDVAKGPDPRPILRARFFDER